MLERRKLSAPGPIGTPGPIAWMAKNNVAANLLMLFLIFGGLTLGTSTKQEVFPEFDLDIISITVPYPGASPADVEQGVILAIEEQIRSIDGIKQVSASASEGYGSITVELDFGVDRNKALSDVKNSIDRITSFPEEAEEPLVSLISNRAEVVTLAVYGQQSEEVLRQIAEDVRTDLMSSKDISYVELTGARRREIAIEISDEQLRRYNLTLATVASRIRQLARDLPSGGIRTSAGEILLRVDERRTMGVEFENLPVVTGPDGIEVSLGSIATITDGFEDIEVDALFNGARALVIRVFRSGDETPILVADAVHTYIEDAQARGLFPPGIEIVVLGDRSQMYRERVDLLLRNARLGLVLVLIILGLFLSARLAFWVTLGIPISFLGALLLLPSLDISINMISLFAFIITLGVVVDDAIVVGENVFEHRQQGKNWMQAAMEGSQTIAMPVRFFCFDHRCCFYALDVCSWYYGKVFSCNSWCGYLCIVDFFS